MENKEVKELTAEELIERHIEIQDFLKELDAEIKSLEESLNG